MTSPDRPPPDDALRAWIDEGASRPPDPERERGAADDVVGAIYRRPEVDSAAVDALLELVAHEIRTPFAVIQGAARLMRERGVPDEHADLVAQIHSNARVGLLLLDRLAEVRGVDSGEVVLDRVPVAIADLVQETVEELRDVVLGTRPVAVDADGAAGVTVHVDVRRVRQIIFNLLANAALNTPADAPVHVCVRPEGDGVEVEVHDDGHGVAPADAEEIFGKFPELGATRQGPGIGLYVSRGLARAHGGDLKTEPAEEAGGVFVLRLPGDGGADGG